MSIGCLVALVLGLSAGVGLRPQPSLFDRPQGPQVVVDET
jgi:hypothetical protein